MDEDRKIIEQLQETNEYQRAQILRLEKALKQAIASQEEIKMSNSSEILKSKEIIDDLNKKLANCISIIDAKNVELLNLQTALGQYYAEIEAKVTYEYVFFFFFLGGVWRNHGKPTGTHVGNSHAVSRLRLFHFGHCMYRNIWKEIWHGQEKNQLKFPSCWK